MNPAGSGDEASERQGARPSIEPGYDGDSPEMPAAAEGPARRERSLTREIWREWVWPFLVVLIAVSTFRSAVADWNDVPTGSMKPSILPGERIFVNKIAYDLKVPFTRVRLARWGDPLRGDVVVLFSPADGKRLVKRVVGVPGDVIEMRNNRLYVNGEEASYSPYDEQELDDLGYHPPPRTSVLTEAVDGTSHPVLWMAYSPVRTGFAPIEVPPGKYFVMGDNRDQSRDSRFFGFVDRESIVGQAKAVVISLDHEKSLTPRWDRFFHSLP